MNRWNLYFRRIRSSHELDKREVQECCRLGGLEITVSRAEGWSRTDARRSTVMTEAEFDAFTQGLVQWAGRSREET